MPLLAPTSSVSLVSLASLPCLYPQFTSVHFVFDPFPKSSYGVKRKAPQVNLCAVCGLGGETYTRSDLSWNGFDAFTRKTRHSAPTILLTFLRRYWPNLVQMTYRWPLINARVVIVGLFVCFAAATDFCLHWQCEGATFSKLVKQGSGIWSTSKNVWNPHDYISRVIVRNIVRRKSVHYLKKKLRQAGYAWVRLCWRFAKKPATRSWYRRCWYHCLWLHWPPAIDK